MGLFYIILALLFGVLLRVAFGNLYFVVGKYFLKILTIDRVNISEFDVRQKAKVSFLGFVLFLGLILFLLILFSR